jgi:hypothetical protein
MVMPAQIEFPFDGSRRIRAVFDAAPISSDGGAVLLAQADKRVGVVEAIARVIPEWRDVRRIDHTIDEVVRQRVFQISLGYEDCNDATTLRSDPVLKTCLGRDPVAGGDLASQPTLSRVENAIGPKTCYRIGSALVDNYVVRQPERPSHVVIDLDTSDDPVHGQQEFRFFHAYYGEYVYLPLLVFDQNGELITAVLQPGKPDGVKTAVAVVRRIVRRIRATWPGISILVRGDSGFGSPKLYALCEELQIDFLVGIGGNKRLKKMAARLAEQARRRFLARNRMVRLFRATTYRARRGWPRDYRLIIKCEHSAQGPNTRFVVTNIDGRADEIYGAYAQRGESSENSIKDFKRALAGDRLSCHRFWANQFRLFLHAAAYVLMTRIRDAAHDTALADVQFDTLRLRLLKIGARVVSSARRIWLHLSAAHPWQHLFHLVGSRLLEPAPA